MMTTDWSASCGVPIVSAESVLASEGGATTALPCPCHPANSSSSAFASFRSRVSNPSVMPRRPRLFFRREIPGPGALGYFFAARFAPLSRAARMVRYLLRDLLNRHSSATVTTLIKRCGRTSVMHCAIC
jgi:hypothetical protein